MNAGHTISNHNAGHRKFAGTGRYHSIKLNGATPQAKKLYNLMKRDGHVTRLTAAHYHIPNPTARIAELRRLGIDVSCTVLEDAEGQRYGRWSVVEA